MKTLCVFGTASNVGKSTVALALTCLLKKQGIRVAPFKAQNMSNNAAVADDGSEIARVQAFHAESAGVCSSWMNNPLLLKPLGGTRSQVIVKGKVWGVITSRDYYDKLDVFKGAVDDALEGLSQEYDVIVAEGAGSPVELNLIDKDLSNTYTAQKTDAKIILVCSIDEGGVFASIYGTYMLLDETLRSNVIGVIINKFRGDMGLFEDGVEIIEKRFGIPVLGILPFHPLPFSQEDSLGFSALMGFKLDANITIGVAEFPKIANFDDLDPFVLDDNVRLVAIKSPDDLSVIDALILPGSKNVFTDLAWLKGTGLFDALGSFTKPLFGICGGYQMMHISLSDPDGVESGQSEEAQGLGFIPGVIRYGRDKVLQKGSYSVFGETLQGYEMHCGRSMTHPLAYEKGNIMGTHLHHVFGHDGFREHFLKQLDSSYEGYGFQQKKQTYLDRFCTFFEIHVKMDTIKSSLDI